MRMACLSRGWLAACLCLLAGPILAAGTDAGPATPTPVDARTVSVGQPAGGAPQTPGATETITGATPQVLPEPTVDAPQTPTLAPPAWDNTNGPAELFKILQPFGALVFSPAPVPAAPTLLPQPEMPATGTVSATNVPAVLPTPTQRGVPSVATMVSPNYVLGPSDTLDLQVWSGAHAQHSGQLIVGVDGSVGLPALGQLNVGGQTLGQVREALLKAYAGIYAQCRVTLVLAMGRVLDVYVLGDVQRPGKQTLTGSATLFAALYAAGGPSTAGSFREVKLLRAGVPAQSFDLYGYLLRGEPTAEVTLQPGDTIFVAPTKAVVAVAGEVRRPALYELTGPTPVAEVLAMAGGLGPLGYAGGLEVWRTQDHRVWTLVSADPQQATTVKLQDGDVLRVKPLLDQPVGVVAIKGEIQRPGSYPLTPGMTAGQLLRLAQGPLERANMQSAVIWRLNANMSYDLVPFSAREALAGKSTSDPLLQERDIIQLFPQSAQEVQIKGHVGRPGFYPFAEGMRVCDLIALAGDLLPGAYTQRATLLRVTPEQKLAVIDVALAAALHSDSAANLRLQAKDLVLIKSRAELGGIGKVQIDGYVQEPDDYDRYEGMHISDLIFAAGGLKPGASSVSYCKGRTSGEIETINLTLQGMGADFTLTPDPVLEDDDRVMVSASGDYIQTPSVVLLDGAVKTRGAYALTESKQPGADGVWSLLQRAGGLLEEADPGAVVLYRRAQAQVPQVNEVKEALNSLNRTQGEVTQSSTLARKPGGNLAAAVQSAVSASIGQQLGQIISSGDTVGVVTPPRLVTLGQVNVMPVNADRLLKTQGAEGDLRLVDGDVLVVHKKRDTVTVVGCVVRPGAVPYVKGRSAIDYFHMLGGPTGDADLRSLLVVRTNGLVSRLHRKLVIAPGDVIIAPSRYLIQVQTRKLDWVETLRTLATTVAAAVLVK